MADVFEDEADQTVSIQELLNDVDEQELEADLVLGGDEGKECTYIKGNMKRQAIFSCLTCTPDGNAGVCTACSLSCHDGHEIVELWTKRNFRCDCGNSKFGEFVCKLFANKDIENDDNSYNHNFKGLYCTCGQPYPDPDAEEQVEMIQCCFCEDWFHEEHLGLESYDEVPRDEEGVPLYEDFMCGVCSTICSFLVLYPQIIQAAGKQLDDTENKGKHVIEDATSACESSNKLENGNSRKLTENDYNLTTKNSGTCILGVDLSVDSPGLDSTKPLFLSKNWRDILCRCYKCMDYYNQKKRISFLLDKEDSIVEYEKMAKQKREEHLQKQEGAELSFLDNLGHVGKMEVLNGIADMKSEIHSFLETFDSSKAVTTDDVRKVFENLAKKRRRIDSSA